MKKQLYLFSTILLSSALFISGCIKEEPEAVYDGETTLEAPQEIKKESNTKRENLDLITVAAYKDVRDIYIKPSSYISIIGMNSKSDFWKAVEQGAKDAVDDINAELTYTGNDKITFTYNAPTSSNAADEQINILDSELSRNPAAIGVSMMDVNAFEVQFDLAIDNGIPVIGFDSANNYSQLASMIGTDNVMTSELVASNLASAIDNEGEIILFAHDSTSNASLTRANTITSYLEEHHPDISLVETVHLDNLDEYRLKLLLTTQPELFETMISNATEEAETEIETETDTSVDTDNNADADNNADTDNNADAETEENIVDELITGLLTEYNKTDAPDELPEGTTDQLLDVTTDQSPEDSTDESLAETPAYIMTDEIRNELSNISDNDVISYVLSSYPNVAGYVTTDSNSCITLLEQLEAAEVDIATKYITSFDADKRQVQALENGLIDGLLVQNPYGMGYATIIACVRSTTSSGNQAIVDTGSIWVTPDNMNDEIVQKLFY